MAGLSDSNTNVKATTVAFNSLYTDISLAFKEHPVKKDILPLRDLDAVKQSIKNLILTNQGERPFQMGIGGNITRYLFEPVTPFVAFSLQEEIIKTIRRHEPRVKNTQVKVIADIDRNLFSVTITFLVQASNTQEEISFALERLR